MWPVSDRSIPSKEKGLNLLQPLSLKIFNKCMLEAAHCMVTKTPLGKKKTVNNWFDYECVTTRRNVRKLLRKFRKSLKY